MTANELLLWLSARKKGSWSQFRGAVEALDLAADDDGSAEDGRLALQQRVQQNLARLGHAEFDTAECENGWRIVPPVLALTTSGSESIGILCGARTSKLLEKLEQAAAGLIFERMPQSGCPDVIRIRAPRPEMLSKLADRAGVLCQADAPTALLSRLPHADNLRSLPRERIPASGKDWYAERFIIEKRMMKWQEISVRDANAPGAQGLFRFTRFQVPHYFLREGIETVKLPGSMGKYYLLWRRGRRVLTYSRDEKTLSVRALFQPPLLAERALILCSGFLPLSSKPRGLPRLTYRDIPEDAAGLAAEILKQDLL
jgi:hypothetical protein